MKSDVFYWLLNMSIHGGLVCLIVLLLRRIPKLPKGFVYALWSLPCLRLVLPFGVDSRWGLMTLLERLGTRRITVPQELGLSEALTGSEIPWAAMNSVCAAARYFPIEYKTNVLENVFETAALVWVIVAAACVLTAAVLYAFTYAEVRHAQKMQGYWRSDRVTAPALYGILRPKILVPTGISETALPYILRHEQVHARRRDNVWRCAAVLLCCIHWFNPLCWLSLKYFFEDMELSCDAAVIRKLDSTERKAYALALLDTAQKRTLFVSAFGGAKIRVRIQTVLSYRRLTAAAVVAFAALFAAVAVTLITN